MRASLYIPRVEIDKEASQVGLLIHTPFRVSRCIERENGVDLYVDSSIWIVGFVLFFVVVLVLPTVFSPSLVTSVVTHEDMTKPIKEGDAVLVSPEFQIEIEGLREVF